MTSQATHRSRQRPYYLHCDTPSERTNEQPTQHHLYRYREKGKVSKMAEEGINLSVTPATALNNPALNNPMPHRLPEGENATPLEVIGTTASDKLVIIMVGLPATGTFKASTLIHSFLHIL